jgi:C-terminal processing protease CtpA/Prc
LAPTPLQGFVHDLRNNPGDVLNGSVDVSGAFINDGLLVIKVSSSSVSVHRDV